MKKLLLLALTTLLINATDAQFLKYGIRVGGATTDISAQDFSNNNLELALNSAGFGIHFGGFVRVKLGPIYLQPEILYNSFSTEYTLNDLANNTSSLLDETYRNLDIPVMIGWKTGPFRIQAGPIGSVPLSRSSDLTSIETYREAADRMTFGYQAGLGLDIGQIILDVKYEGSLSKFGDGATIAGQEVNFDGRLSRFVFTLGFAF